MFEVLTRWCVDMPKTQMKKFPIILKQFTSGFQTFNVGLWLCYKNTQNVKVFSLTVPILAQPANSVCSISFCLKTKQQIKTDIAILHSSTVTSNRTGLQRFLAVNKVQNYLQIEGSLKIIVYWGRKTPKRW